jgi:hypothetical protein
MCNRSNPPAPVSRSSPAPSKPQLRTWQARLRHPPPAAWYDICNQRELGGPNAIRAAPPHHPLTRRPHESTSHQDQDHLANARVAEAGAPRTSHLTAAITTVSKQAAGAALCSQHSKGGRGHRHRLVTVDGQLPVTSGCQQPVQQPAAGCELWAVASGFAPTSHCTSQHEGTPHTHTHTPGLPGGGGGWTALWQRAQMTEPNGRRERSASKCAPPPHTRPDPPQGRPWGHAYLF